MHLQFNRMLPIESIRFDIDYRYSQYQTFGLLIFRAGGNSANRPTAVIGSQNLTVRFPYESCQSILANQLALPANNGLLGWRREPIIVHIKLTNCRFMTYKENDYILIFEPPILTLRPTDSRMISAKRLTPGPEKSGLAKTK